MIDIQHTEKYLPFFTFNYLFRGLYCCLHAQTFFAAKTKQKKEETFCFLSFSHRIEADEAAKVAKIHSVFA
jgi:hypothetical protein